MTYAAITVRPETEADEPRVRGIHDRAFAGHGIGKYADDLRRLVSAEAGSSLVAERAGEVVGHVLLVPALLDSLERLVRVQVLSPLGVDPPHQGAGVGSALVRAGLAAAEAQGAPVVFLEGSPRYYPRFGFAPGAGLGFRRPSLRIPEPAFQTVTLSSYEPWMTGTLVYPQAVWATTPSGSAARSSPACWLPAPGRASRARLPREPRPRS